MKWPYTGTKARHETLVLAGTPCAQLKHRCDLSEPTK